MSRKSLPFVSLLSLTALLQTEAGLAQNFDALEYRNVGPTRGGRVTAVAGTVQAPGTFYLGASGGGVWKTSDYGTTWNNISDGYFASPSIGDIAASQTDTNLLYVGTGSDGLRSNVIPGKGVYKSTNGGDSWTHIGLEDSGHIGAVEIDPTDNNTVWVAAIGSAFADNPERGLYKTENGGVSWSQVLKISDAVGIADVELLPNNPEVVFAAAWKARRQPWTIISGGTQEEGGLFKSVDGGDNWRRITAGLPTGLIGKIDIAISASDSSVVYALVEAPGEEGGLYRSDDQGETFTQVSSKKGLRIRPFYYGNVEADPTDADVVYVLATDYFKSVDGGKSWEELEPPHGDNHDMWINPEDPQLFIQANDGGANVTHNGGLTWSSQFNQATTELYTVDVDDQYPYWLYAGQQDNGTAIAVPSRAPYSVQNVNAWLIEAGGCETGPAVPKPGDHTTVYANCKGRFSTFNKNTGTERSYYVGATNMYGQNPKDLKYRFQRVAPVAVSPHDPNVVYHGSQYVHRTSDNGVTWETISPDLTAFEADKQVVSGSPITRDVTGEEVYSTLYSIRESAIAPGVIWTGSNDGPVHVTRDGGESWDDVTPRGLPKGGRVDSVEPSRHDPAVAYIAVLRYQLGDDKPYAYRTADYGKRWTLMTDGKNGIPADYPVRVVREDPVRPGLLYAGTDSGLFVSFDDGDSWQSFQQNLPITPVTDIRVHRDDLVVSTMGRAFWVLDDISALRQDPMPDMGDAVVLFEPAETLRYRDRPTYGDKDPDAIPQYREPSAIIDYYLPEGFDGSVTLEITTADGEFVNAFTNADAMDGDERGERVDDMAMNEIRYIKQSSLTAEGGLNRFHWDMRYRGPWRSDEKKRFTDGALAAAGEYKITLSAGDETLSQPLSIVMDPRVLEMGVTEADVQAQLALQRQVLDLLDQARRKAHSLENELESLGAGDSPRRSAIENAIRLLVTEKGTYMQPRLISQISYLSRMLDRADQEPGGEALARFDELQAEYEAVLEALEG
ncbi:WD40/YVTN/BNR-like repeat-containing protein [Congregibacter litoralis]|uniref:Sortilin N-terminal domain-containing protein n=1 Tax=Congregibacter litoralis KT71 TaxID=314285 RepID=A4A772_9GAMM|nr:hypothetical protein [Congregibacter litoralis]EAQ98141.2 hypothetical protein KT71_02802 [Congregibacter litoralis KT71]